VISQHHIKELDNPENKVIKIFDRLILKKENPEELFF
jgi:hypothetical protein